MNNPDITSPEAYVPQQVWLTVNTGLPDFATPASPAQERIWLASQLAPGAQYRINDQLWFYESADADALIDALQTVLTRHESLRTAFTVDDGVLLQRVSGRVEVPISYWDYADLPFESIRPLLGRVHAWVAEQEIPMHSAPLLQAAVIAGQDGAGLSWSVHHTVMDAASVLTLRGELTELVSAARAGREPELPELPIQYADYSEWYRQQLQAELPELDAFWSRQLADLPATHRIPLDRPRPDERTFAGDEVVVRPDPALRAGVADLARQFRATEFMVWCSALAAVVARWSDSDDFAIGVPVSGRDRADLEPVVGMFVNMIVLRVDASGDPTFGELLTRLRAVTLDSLEHQRMPFQRLVHQFAGDRSSAAPPLYQIGFNFIPMTLPTSAGAAEDDLLCEVGDTAVRLEYNTALFTEQTVRQVATALLDLVGVVVGDPDRRLSSLPAPVRPVPGIPVEAEQESVPAGKSADKIAHQPGPPQDDLEQLVARICMDVLEVDTVDRSDDFFLLGGHSLLALRVIARLREAADVDLPIAEFFDDTTVAGIAAALGRAMLAELSALSDTEAAALAGELAAEERGATP